MVSVFVCAAKPPRRLTLFYICNEIVQTCKRKRATSFKDSFEQVLLEAVALVRFNYYHYSILFKIILLIRPPKMNTGLKR